MKMSEKFMRIYHILFDVATDRQEHPEFPDLIKVTEELYPTVWLGNLTIAMLEDTDRKSLVVSCDADSNLNEIIKLLYDDSNDEYSVSATSYKLLDDIFEYLS